MTGPFDPPESPDEPTPVSSPLRIFLNRLFVGSTLVFYLLDAAWGLLGNPLVAGGWLR